jgi:hypothetical protein
VTLFYLKVKEALERYHLCNDLNKKPLFEKFIVIIDRLLINNAVKSHFIN